MKKANLLVLTILSLMLSSVLITMTSTNATINRAARPPGGGGGPPGGGTSTLITNPSDGDTVSGTLTITLSRQATLYIDGAQVGSRITSYSWDTTEYDNGDHTIRATSFRTTHSITVTVDNEEGEDTTAPTVSISSPSNGATVDGTVTITASASDNVGVTSVVFYIDDTIVGTDTTSSYTYSWDTTSYTDDSHTIYAIAYDAAGNYGTSTTITVTVDNSGGGTEESKYAVIVGISDYEAISDLSYCDEDASDWYDYLIDIGYDSDNIIVLGDNHQSNYPKYTALATEYNIKYYLEWLCALDCDEILYITSGHGGGNGQGSSFICTWDCYSGENGEDGYLYDTELEDIFENTVADKVFVFVDHCYAGGFIPELSSVLGSKLYMTTTCTQAGYGYDYTPQRNGAWTYYFLEYALINHFGSDPNTAMEDAFDYALAAYPYGGNDTPQEEDNYSGDFTL